MLGTDKVRKKVKPSPLSRLPAQKGAKYSDLQKIELVKLWLVTGNLLQAAVALKIEPDTAKKWKATQWWTDMVNELRQENSIQLSTRLKAVAFKSLELVADRLENGDFVLNQKTGEIVRKPVGALDASKITQSMLERYEKIERYVVRDNDQKQLVDHLTQLKQAFQSMSKSKVEVTDVIFSKEITNAVHDKREEGLQKGVELGAQEETKPGEGSFSEESSEVTSGKENREFTVI